MRRRVGFIALTSFVGLLLAVQGASSSSQPVVPKLIAAGKLKPAVIHLKNGQTKRLPFFSGGILSTIEQASGAAANANRALSAGGVAGASVDSLGCRDRAGGRDIRVNQDCTYRRQAETNIAYNPTDPTNLVAGVNDSIIGWNQTSLDFSLDSGSHWGSISTAPFRYRLNAPETLLKTADDPNRHTFTGTTGTLHSYDACSDPYLAFDSAGRAFYTCVAFDIASNAGLVFVVPSLPGAKGSSFDQVYAPYDQTPPATGREHIVMEDNSPAASPDGPKVAADAFADQPEPRQRLFVVHPVQLHLRAGRRRVLLFEDRAVDVDRPRLHLVDAAAGQRLEQEPVRTRRQVRSDAERERRATSTGTATWRSCRTAISSSRIRTATRPTTRTSRS